VFVDAILGCAGLAGNAGRGGAGALCGVAGHFGTQAGVGGRIEQRLDCFLIEMRGNPRVCGQQLPEELQSGRHSLPTSNWLSEKWDGTSDVALGEGGQPPICRMQARMPSTIAIDTDKETGIARREGPRRSDLLAAAYREIARLEPYLLGVVALGSAYYTWLGFAADQTSSGDWFQKSKFLVIAVAIGFAVYAIWRVALSLVPALTGWRKFRGFVTVLFSLLLVMGISSYFNLAGFKGSEALMYQLKDEAGKESEALKELLEQTQTILGQQGRILEDIKSKANEYRSKAGEEGEGKGLSQAKGHKDAFIAFGQVAGSFEAKRDEGLQDLNHADGQVAAAKVALQVLETSLDRPGPIFEKIHRLEVKKNEAQAAVALAYESVAKLNIGGLLQDATQNSKTPACVSRDKTKSEASRISLEALCKRFADSGNLTQKILDPIKIPETIKTQHTVYEALFWAIWHNPATFMPALLAAGFVDALPLLLLFFKSQAVRQLEADSRDRGAL
jgi:hypothetical protein